MFQSWPKWRIVLAFLACCVVINPALAQSDAFDEADEAFTDDIIGYEVPAVQLMLLHDDVSGINIEAIFADAVGQVKLFEIDLVNASFRVIDFAYKASWLDAAGEQINKRRGGWTQASLRQAEVMTLELEAPSADAVELLLFIRKP